VWSRAVDGRELHFRLGGINHQNFLMYDEETQSWWQQISGECILGPLRGKRLTRVPSDEVTLAIWRAEHPESTAVRFNPKYLHRYSKSDWEHEVEPLDVTDPVEPGSPLATRDLVAGVMVGGEAAAFPFSVLRAQTPINAKVGGAGVLVIVDAGGASVRAFLRGDLEFFRKTDTAEYRLVDSATGSAWDFAGRAVAGPMAGKTLERVQVTKDYWFDWRRYHPESRVYRTR
jgi:hypothetical protein